MTNRSSRPRVLNRRTDLIPGTAVYVGRPGPWGNPFKPSAGTMQARLAVIAQYRAWLMADPSRVAAARRALRGRDLVCWCAPLPCHADVLMEVANADD